MNTSQTRNDSHGATATSNQPSAVQPGLLPLYLQQQPAKDGAGAFDVIARKRPGGRIVARWPWWYSSRPDYGNWRVVFNCY